MRRATWRPRRAASAALVLGLGLTWTQGLLADAGQAQDGGGGNSQVTASERKAEISLDLRGNGLPAPRRLGAAELGVLPRVEARTRDGSGKETVYAGVSLMEVLRAGGLRFDPGMAGMRETVRTSVLVEAADGYRALFALAELDPALTERTVLLADARDGQPLEAAEGPLRLVVPGERRPARWVRQVTAVTVRRD